MKWRLIHSGISTAAVNMAIDEAIMLAHSRGEVPPTLRFYGWEPAAVSMGYFQRVKAAIDRQECDRLGIDVVRRLTGGRAVLHDRELTYSIVIHENHPSIPATISASYRYLSRGLIGGLLQLGVTAAMSMPREAYGKINRARTAPSSAACFDAPSHYELTFEGRKVIGSAQVRKYGVVLQHGSILLDFSPGKTAAVLVADAAEKKQAVAQILACRAASLSEILGYNVNREEVYKAMCKSFAESLEAEFTEAFLTEEELETSRRLATSKYNQCSWNMMR